MGEPSTAIRAPQPRSAIVAWVLFDPAAQPFFSVITTFIFAPYFAANVAPDAVTGQALWGMRPGPPAW